MEGNGGDIRRWAFGMRADVALVEGRKQTHTLSRANIPLDPTDHFFSRSSES